MNTDAYLKELGRNIRRVREERKLSQAALAEETGIALRTIRRLENGAGPVAIDKVISIMIVLDASPNYVFSFIS